MLDASLNAFFCASPITLRRRFHVSAGRYRQQRGNTSCEAANRRNEKKVQQRRPPPAADTGRSCWGRGQQDTSATQGTKWSLGTATRLSAATSFFPFRQLLWGLKGASSPFLVGPARRNRWCFLVLFWCAKENLALVQERSSLRRRRKDHSSVICSPSSSARISAPVAGRLRTR